MISMSLQCKHRVIARLPCFAVQIYRSVLRDFFHTLPDLTNGNIYRCFYLSHAIGLLVPDVHNKGFFLHKAAPWSTRTCRNVFCSRLQATGPV